MRLEELPPNLRTFICAHVFRNERPIGFVFNDDDGDIGMTCGENDCDANDIENIKSVGLGHMIERDPKLKQIEWLPRGFGAFFDTKSGWVFSPLNEEEETQ